MQQGMNVEPSLTLRFPQAVHMVANGRSIETVVNDQNAFDAFVRRHGGGCQIHLLESRRLPNLL